MSMGPEWGNPSILRDSNTMCTAQDLGLVISMLQPCNGSKEKTQLNSGGQVACPYLPPIALLEGLFLLGLKNKHTQALPLKEDFSQFARPGNSRVSRLHEVRRLYLKCKLLKQSKAIVHKELSN